MNDYDLNNKRDISITYLCLWARHNAKIALTTTELFWKTRLPTREFPYIKTPGGFKTGGRIGAEHGQ